jgi:type IV pilus assembly protein PilN
MIRINILPYREERKRTELARQIMILAGTFVIFFLVVASVHLYMTISTRSLAHEVKAAEDKLAALGEVTGDLDKIKKDKMLLEKKIAIIEDLEKGRGRPVVLMEELSATVPIGQVWISTIEKGEDTLRVEGIAIDNPAIALFMQQLEKSPVIASVDLVSSELTTISGTRLMNFKLLCGIRKG